MTLALGSEKPIRRMLASLQTPLIAGITGLPGCFSLQFGTAVWKGEKAAYYAAMQHRPKVV
jgi:hypothetical protein